MTPATLGGMCALAFVAGAMIGILSERKNRRKARWQRWLKGRVDGRWTYP